MGQGYLRLSTRAVATVTTAKLTDFSKRCNILVWFQSSACV